MEGVNYHRELLKMLPRLSGPICYHVLGCGELLVGLTIVLILILFQVYLFVEMYLSSDCRVRIIRSLSHAPGEI